LANWPAAAAPRTPAAASPSTNLPQPAAISPAPPRRLPGTAAEPPLPPASTTSVALLKVPLRLVGVIGRLYIVLESDRGLVLMDQLVAAGQEINSFRLGEQTVAKTVCRHAVKANDPLSGPELEKLIEDLRTCAMPYTCPHGRPTLLEMNYRELEKKFGRTQ